MSLASRSLVLSFVASLALHGAIVLVAGLPVSARPTPGIEVRLPQMPDSHADDLLKNTMRNSADASTRSPRTPDQGRGSAYARIQQQRLAAHVFYPPLAVEQGLEGEVRLLLRLDGKGHLLEARVASTSGHDILDQAAVAAAYAAGEFPGAGAELILPVVFRLSE